jgi:hypothetical protein
MRSVLILAALLSFVVGCSEKESAVVTTETPTATTTVAPEAPAAEAPPSTPEPLPEHDVTGAYFAMAKLPAEFAELDHLMLATIDENAEPAPLNGFLRPKKQSATDYTLVNPTMQGKALTFTTKPVDGVSYSFTGAFDVLGKFAENPPDYETAVLTGTLTKLRGTQQVAVTPVKFRYEAGG